jgi:hypothetical protein
MYAETNRKKVRGWRRRVRAITRWREASADLDVDALMRREATWAKIALDPWNRLVRRNPPMWYRRLVLAALVDIHARWHARLAALGVPFVLRLWLRHPRFHSSQVVAAVGSKMEYYALHVFPFPDADPVPIDIYRSPELPLDDFIWQARIDFEPIFEQACELAPGEIAHYASRAFRIDHHDDDTVYLIDCGTAWVGERRGDSKF